VPRRGLEKAGASAAAFGDFLIKGTKTLSEAEIRKLLDTLKQPAK
jgi:hypothetical protein